jgi:hypothetical protein
MRIVTARLLQIDVFSRLEGEDRRRRVPVIRRSDRDGVDVLVVERAPKVADRPG